MGTSTSHGGPKDRPALLPDWALPTPIPPNPPAVPPDDTPLSTPTPLPPHPAAPPLNPPPTPTYGPLVGAPRWTRAGRSLGRVAASGGGRSVGRSAQRYVRALGGARRAAASSTGGRRATSRFAGFLSDVARGGVADALSKLGLGSVIGRDLDSVIAAVADAVCPTAAGREDVAAREATAEALEEVFAGAIGDGGDLMQLDSMTPEGVGRAVESMVASYIYNRWLGDLGAKIEEKAISPQAAVRVERRMREFIRDAVKIDLQARDPLTIDWRGAEGRTMMERIYREAFVVIGGEQ